MKLHHTGSISLDEILEAIREKFRAEGYEPTFNKEQLEKIVTGKKVEVSLTLINKEINSLISDVKQNLFFHDNFFRAIIDKQSLLGIFFHNVAQKEIIQKVKTTFLALGEQQQKILIERFELKKEANVKILRSGQSQFSYTEINKALGELSSNLLALLEASINTLSLEYENTRDKSEILLMSIRECGFSVRVKNCLIAANRLETVGELMKEPEKELAKFRNFGLHGTREVRLFKKLMRL